MAATRRDSLSNFGLPEDMCRYCLEDFGACECDAWDESVCTCCACGEYDCEYCRGGACDHCRAIAVQAADCFPADLMPGTSRPSGSEKQAESAAAAK